MPVHHHTVHPLEDVAGRGSYRWRMHVDEGKSSREPSRAVKGELDMRERDADFGKGRAEL
jgi:hypothetical protein